MLDFLQQKFNEVFNINQENINSYEALQKRIKEKYSYLVKVLKLFNNFNSFTQDYIQKLTSLKIPDVPHNQDDQKLHDLFTLIFNTLSNNISINKKSLENIVNELTQITNLIQNEKSSYSDLKKTYNQLINEKKNVEKNKKTYHEIGLNLEKTCIENKITDEQNLNEDLLLYFDSAKKELNNYKNSINKCNQLVNNYNNKQGKLLEFFPQLIEADCVFDLKLLKIIISCLEENNKLITSCLEETKDQKYLINEQKIKELIENLESIIQKEPLIEHNFYQSTIDFYKCDDENDFNKYNKIIQLMKKKIDNSFYPKYNEEAEKIKFNLNQLFTKSFSENSAITQEQSDNLINFLKDPSTHNIFLTLLSLLRTNNRTVRNKDIIELLAKSLNVILDEAEKNKNYDAAKNCIILSQTYYYLDENEKKIYVVEYTKKHPWMTDPNFWREIIDEMIKNEFIRLQNLFPQQKMDIVKNVNVSPQIVPKLNEILFTQLIPYTNNMVEFQVNKVIIVKILDEFLKKYNYLNQSNTESLFGLVASSPEEIEKLRSEYSPELEKTTNNEEKEVENKKEESEKVEEKKEESEKVEEKKEESENKEENKEEDKKE